MDAATRVAIDRRMRHQGLWSPTAPDATSALRSLTAMQAQEFSYALWGLAQRVSPGPTAVDQATMRSLFDAGAILRTHVLRTTWHFVLPEDARWLIRLTAPRLRRLTSYYDRKLGLDRRELDRAQAVLAAAVSGGRHRTRQELSGELESAGVPAKGQRLGHLMMHAEFDEVLISGAMRGKQQTYGAFDERVPDGPDRDPDSALAELARRFVATRGPVTARDLATWASLTVTQARRGLSMIEKDCTVEDLDGMTAYSLQGEPAGRPAPARIPVVDLVQGYDEVVMSYSESRGLVTAGLGTLPVPDRSSYLHAILVDGRLAGHWRHQLEGGVAVVQTQPRRTLTGAEREALRDAADRYVRYLNGPIGLE